MRALSPKSEIRSLRSAAALRMFPDERKVRGRRSAKTREAFQQFQPFDTAQGPTQDRRTFIYAPFKPPPLSSPAVAGENLGGFDDWNGLNGLDPGVLG